MVPRNTTAINRRWHDLCRASLITAQKTTLMGGKWSCCYLWRWVLPRGHAHGHSTLVSSLYILRTLYVYGVLDIPIQCVAWGLTHEMTDRRTQCGVQRDSDHLPPQGSERPGGGTIKRFQSICTRSATRYLASDRTVESNSPWRVQRGMGGSRGLDLDIILSTCTTRAQTMRIFNMMIFNPNCP